MTSQRMPFLMEHLLYTRAITVMQVQHAQMSFSLVLLTLRSMAPMSTPRDVCNVRSVLRHPLGTPGMTGPSFAHSPRCAVVHWSMTAWMVFVLVWQKCRPHWL